MKHKMQKDEPEIIPTHLTKHILTFFLMILKGLYVALLPAVL